MLDDHGLARYADSGSVTRGLDYARRGRARVTSHTTEPGSVKGLIRGSGGIFYEADVSYGLDSSGAVSSFAGWCSCPVGDDCKHAVALLLTALTARNLTRAAEVPPPPGAPSPPPSAPQTGRGITRPGRLLTVVPPAPPTVPVAPTAPVAPVAPVPAARSWESLLSGIAGTTPGGGETPTEPLGLAFELTAPSPVPVGVPRRWSPTRSNGPTEGRLAIRPVCQGTQGKWIRTGVSWSDLAHGYARWRFREDHVRILSAIVRLNAGDSRYNYSGTDPWIQLTAISSPTLWDLLAEAVAAGLPLLTLDAGQPTVQLVAEQAELTVDVGRTEGGLLVAPVIRLEGHPVPADQLIFLGDPAHGVVTWPMGARGQAGPPILARLDRRADQSVRTLFTDGGVRIPDGEEPLFFEEFVPALRRRHTVRSVDPTLVLPEAHPPVLVVTVTSPAAHEVRFDWSWAYRTGDSTREIPLPGGLDQVRRDPVAEGRILTEVAPLLSAVPGLADTTRQFALPVSGAVATGRDAITLIDQVLPALRLHPSVEVRVVGVLPEFRESADAPVISLRSTPSDGSRDWFDLTVTITIGDDEIPFEPVFLALAAGDEVMILPDGGYFELDRPEFRQLRALIEEARGLSDRPEGPLRISRFQAGLWDELERLGVVDAQSTEWLARVNQWRVDPELVDLDPPSGVQATLRPYQLEGFRWLNLLRENGLGGILADDMGLGKTLQTLAMVVRARDRSPGAPPFLVVAPTSVVGNWQSEAARFAPGLRTVAVTGTQARRRTALADLVDGADLVVTSYTLFRLEFDGYDALPWEGLILDEAQVVKNHQSKAFACAKRLAAPVKFAITGTPMENNLMELWALFSLVAPGLFANPVRFGEVYRVPIERGTDPEALPRLRRRIAPLMLRRTKEAVASDLPEKQEQVLELELEPAHRKVYQRQLQRERQKILGLIGDMDKNRFAIFRSLMLLRQASIDPFLIDPANAGVPSTKLNVLMELLGDVIAEGHRTLIFSQFTGFLARVRERLDAEGIRYSYLDGATRDRPTVLTEFREGNNPVFLISLKAGGVGLNLTEADYCILLDPWWNPAAEAQAVDRTHRIGQTRKVMVYRLVSKDTIEEKVMALKAAKAELFAGVMAGVADDGDATLDAPSGAGDATDGVGSAGSGKAINADDIRALLS